VNRNVKAVMDAFFSRLLRYVYAADYSIIYWNTSPTADARLLRSSGPAVGCDHDAVLRL